MKNKSDPEPIVHLAKARRVRPGKLPNGKP